MVKGMEGKVYELYVSPLVCLRGGLTVAYRSSLQSIYKHKE